MSSNNLSGEQFRLHRGLRDVSGVDELSRSKGLGQHWTDDLDIASQFATQTGPVGSRQIKILQQELPDRGVVVSAIASKKDALDEDKDWEELDNLEANVEGEKETTLRRGSKVKVTSVTAYEVDSKNKESLRRRRNSTRRRRTRLVPPLELEV